MQLDLAVKAGRFFVDDANDGGTFAGLYIQEAGRIFQRNCMVRVADALLISAALRLSPPGDVTDDSRPPSARLNAMIDWLETRPDAAERESIGNRDENSSDLKLPPVGDQLDLWKRLRDEQGSGKTDREIARDYSPERGEKVLDQLKTQRTKGKLSNWKLR